MDGKGLDLDPMQMPYWSIGMACVWIATRDPVVAAGLWSQDFGSVLLADDDSANEAIQSARDEMWTALKKGFVTATRLDDFRGRVPIDQIEWEDMSYTYDLGDDGLIHRLRSGTGAIYSAVLVTQKDVLKSWPVATGAQAKSATAADENRAIIEASKVLKENSRITKPDLLKHLQGAGCAISAIGFKQRVWPKAREAAGLSRAGKSGAPKKSVTP